MGVTHILTRTDLLNKYLKDNFSENEIARFVNLVNIYWKLLYEVDGYAVWEIKGG